MDNQTNIYLAWDAFNNGFIVTANAIKLLSDKGIFVDEIIYLHDKSLQESNQDEINVFFTNKHSSEVLRKYSNNENISERLKKCYKIKGLLKTNNLPSFKPILVRIDGVTNYQSIYDSLVKFLKEEFKNSKNFNLHINVSPGTPHMHVVWLMLNSAGFLPKETTLWSSQFIKETKKTVLNEVKFKPQTFLGDVLKSTSTDKFNVNINPNETRSVKRKKAEENLRVYFHIPNAPILLLGERGTGKSTYVRNLVSKEHNTFHELAVGTFSEDLMRSELFGYEKGAFTGALKTKNGILDDFREGGLLFLDEIQDLSKPLQRQLMQILQTGKYYPIGSDKPKEVKFKLVVASNLSIPELLKKLSLDFFDRISRFIVEIPPLRECVDDHSIYWVKAWNEIADFSDAPNLVWNDEIMNFLRGERLDSNFRDIQKLISHLISYKIQKQSDEEATKNAINEFSKWSNIINEAGLTIKNKYFVKDRSYKNIVSRFNKDLANWAIETYGSVKNASETLNRGESTIREDKRGGKSKNNVLRP